MTWVFAQWEPVAGGRLLLLAAGLVTSATAPIISPGLHSYEVLAVVTAVMTALLITSFLLPWPRMPKATTVVFPVLVWLAVGTLGVAAHGLGSNFTGLFTLCFAYLGLSQRTGTIVKLVPVAVLCWIGAFDGWTTQLAPRLLIGVSVWMLLSLLIAELVDRQLVLTRRLRHAAQTDALTGLGNRREFDRRVALARPGDAVVICDLDHFKLLNDTQGHAAGDRVLAQFGAILRACLRDGDHASRYGGEEFAVTLALTTAAQATSAMDRVRRQWAPLETGVTFSAGIATFRDDRSPDLTVSAADRALYAAKAAGRDQTCLETAELPPPESAGRIAGVAVNASEVPIVHPDPVR